MEKLQEKVRTMTTDQILETVTLIGGGDDVTIEQRMVRVALLSVYEERTSGEEVDALMDVLGM